MSAREFKVAVSRCSFLFDWQKEKLMGMLEGVDGVDDGNGRIHANVAFPVVDNVLWRMMGVGLDSLPVGDRMNIERAIREVSY